MGTTIVHVFPSQVYLTVPTDEWRSLSNAKRLERVKDELSYDDLYFVEKVLPFSIGDTVNFKDSKDKIRKGVVTALFGESCSVRVGQSERHRLYQNLTLVENKDEV